MAQQDKKNDNDGNDLFDQKFINVIPERYDSDPYSYNSRDSALYRLVLPVVLGLVALSVLGVTVRHLFFADTSNQAGITGTPVIHADERPIKTRPVDRGGIDIPNQDKLVYERVGSGKAGNIEERLLPPPEQPLIPPVPEQNRASGHIDETQDNRHITQQPDVAAITSPSTAPGAVSTDQTLHGQSSVPQIPIGELHSALSAAENRTEHKTEQKAEQKISHSPPVSPLDGRVWLVQLASVRSEQEATREWGHVRGEYRELLGGLSSDIVRVDLGEKGVFWRLRAGPLGEEQARKLCVRLGKEDQRCMVVHK